MKWTLTIHTETHSVNWNNSYTVGLAPHQSFSTNAELKLFCVFFPTNPFSIKATLWIFLHSKWNKRLHAALKVLLALKRTNSHTTLHLLSTLWRILVFFCLLFRFITTHNYLGLVSITQTKPSCNRQLFPATKLCQIHCILHSIKQENIVEH